MKKKPKKDPIESQFDKWDSSMQTFSERLFEELSVDEETSFRYRKTLLDRYSREKD
tara:strand:+ start:199 stop:366 length:168 start_codon:yes stop_codon:yes gene_type:complete